MYFSKPCRMSIRSMLNLNLRYSCVALSNLGVKGLTQGVLTRDRWLVSVPREGVTSAKPGEMHLPSCFPMEVFIF